jgi:plastocyanin
MPHRPTRRATAVAATLALTGLVLASGCGTDSASASKSSTTADAAGSEAPVQSGLVKVGAVDNNFKAEDVTITAGSQITWTNAGRNDHNIVPDPDQGGGDYGVTIDAFKPGESHTATFATPGTYHYFCSIHGTAARGMVGTVTVVAP